MCPIAIMLLKRPFLAGAVLKEIEERGCLCERGLWFSLQEMTGRGSLWRKALEEPGLSLVMCQRRCSAKGAVSLKGGQW